MKQSLEHLRKYLEVFSEFDFLKPYKDKAEDLLRKVEEGKLYVVFVGEFNSGKTSLINALFNINLPTNILPETATIWRVFINKGNNNSKVFIHLLNGSIEEINSVEEVKNYNPANIKYVDVYVKGELDEGVIIVDTPGLSSLNEHHKKVLEDFINEADVLLLVMDINQQLTKSLMDFVQNHVDGRRKMYAVINQIDKKPPSSVKQVKEYIRTQFKGLVDDIATVSAKNGNIGELKDLLEEISSQKVEIILSVAEEKIRRLCKEALNIVNKQIEDANLDLTDLLEEKKKVKMEIEQLQETIEKKKEKVKKEVNKAIDKASYVFISYLESRIDWIVEGLYDENLKETIEDRFDQAIREAVDEALKSLSQDLERIFNEFIYIGDKLAEKFNIGKNLAIIVAQKFVEFREFLLEVLLFFLSKRFSPYISQILRKAADEAIKAFTIYFVKKKVKDAIENPDLKRKFVLELEREISKNLDELFKDVFEDLERQKQSYEKAYEELIQKMKKKEKEFYEYIEKLKEVRGKLEVCGGA